MHGTHIGEAASGIADCKLCTGITPEKEESCIFLCRVCHFFFIGVDIIKDGFSRSSAGPHIVCDLHGLVRIDVAVPGKS